jgi:hypothetical protein
LYPSHGFAIHLLHRCAENLSFDNFGGQKQKSLQKKNVLEAAALELGFATAPKFANL